MSDFKSDNELGAIVASDYRQAATSAGLQFVPIYLICDALTNIERVSSFERMSGGTGKLTDSEVLRSIHKSRLFRFGDLSTCEVDTTIMPAIDVARQILRFLRQEDDLVGG
jgi:RNase P/RNase MRP subunit POP5